ncbi:MAG: 23S rRNA (adenine(2503)-C(2))-methyltransferase RlmN [Gammaproteobacteria bacterium]|nr:23S rRNA (adenine(2503)-C(2))-methyltransferase RlmN [Gammaproteobacteria bacterium]MDH4313806.1 23S rRNA (adenine(2503)-C(2))-methyltransferase RlmN [Gammaproteobacteria bacterium]MDH5214807.1 23S rRNA (adenine(2503)-C(2))-methyltransferase RlmN [Gammaproteobacteria bacterium]MDH5501654.1 23S rRNA (adenine(2503)-C(2))-methyltransferase RlmN [Gammaproteobacteria bacterium]
MNNTEKVNLLGLPQSALENFFAGIGEKPFRARQVLQWIHQRNADGFDVMTDLSKSLRSKLDESAVIQLPKPLSEQASVDGTVKWLFESGAGQAVETVFIPEPGRGTLCISSQVGCALDCSFCATGAQGFNRNLTTAEIVGQVNYANRVLPARPNGEPAVTNVVFMGMGEPLANFRNLLAALDLLLSDFSYGLSRRRITVSTSGIVPQIHKLGDECNVSLAVSLHAPNDELRNQLVPINRIHPIATLLDACWIYAAKRANRFITFEYVMLRDVNDSLDHARQLADLLRDKPAKINLIPFNPFSGNEFRRSHAKVIGAFQAFLREQGIVSTTRKTRGDDIDAACGQLAGKVSDRIRNRLSEKKTKVATA